MKTRFDFEVRFEDICTKLDRESKERETREWDKIKNARSQTLQDRLDNAASNFYRSEV